MARTVLPIAGAVIGAYFGQPQIGYAIGAVIGNAVDPVKVQGPRLGETGVQTSAEGAFRAIIYGAIACTGNVIVAGPLVLQEVETSEGKGGGPVTSTEHGYRTFAIRICEGPVDAILRIWEDDKLVYDNRTVSAMMAESAKWIAGCTIYLGGEDQLPDPNLETEVNSDMPAYRGTCYMVFSMRDLTDRRGSIPQYRFEVAKNADSIDIGSVELVGDNGTFYTDIATDADGNVLMLENQVGDTPFGVYEPSFNGSFQINTYSKDDLSLINSTTAINEGDAFEPGADQRMGPIGISANGIYFSATGDGTNAANRTLNGGMTIGHLLDDNGDRNWGVESTNGNPIQYGGLIFFHGGSLLMGINRGGYNKILRWTGQSGSPNVAPANVVVNPVSPNGGGLAMHVSRSGVVRAVSRTGWPVINEYNLNLSFTGTRTIPSGPWADTTKLMAFGIDETKNLQAYIYEINFDARIAIFNLAGTLISDQFIAAPAITDPGVTKILFTDENIFFMRRKTVYRVSAGNTFSALTIPLSDIVDDIHERCQVPSGKWDSSELTDEVQGLLLAGDYTGADAINTLRAPYFFDKFEADKSIWYPKRGADAAFVIDVDDLVEEPDVTKREQAIEYPKKMHLQYQHANSGYAVVKATSSRSSTDARVIGETGISVPVVLTEDQSAQTVAKMHKVAWTEADGSIELALPDSFIEFTPTDVGSVTLRGQTTRRRIVKSDYADGVIRWTLIKDRQSAYTSEVEGVPVPDPTPPPSTITGATILAVMDIPSRIDTEDDLNIYYGVTGAMPAWYGATVQRSLDGGANYTNIISINTASIIGFISGTVADASEHVTDTTNTITVTLYRDGQALESLTNTQFLQEQGAFALEKPDGSWEIMQYLDADLDTSGRFVLSHLHRGQLNSGTSEHNEGALFVMLERPTHISMPSSLIGIDLTHRAPSFEQSPELALGQTDEYIGRSQIEWPPAYLQLGRIGNDISGSWVARHRFGSDMNPIASINFQGFRVTIDGGSNGAETFDTTASSFENYDTTSLGGNVTVSVSALNRITGAGPSTSGDV